MELGLIIFLVIVTFIFLLWPWLLVYLGVWLWDGAKTLFFRVVARLRKPKTEKS